MKFFSSLVVGLSLVGCAHQSSMSARSYSGPHEELGPVLERESQLYQSGSHCDPHRIYGETNQVFGPFSVIGFERSFGSSSSKTKVVAEYHCAP
ncbi:hypothetical protein [Pseudobacteriovorax antillogorgiicola]|uniref:Lipoprotein n=1 Tax=Pseudobacteriovorax antillogorgiicola TaxID=1513793 RepID=A0A1Y6CIF3_9BACT|nr:hypothetical protein [Pseudobacteriovorax antillogorgiicola]TCS46919.1 hypothetical protein EDD56_12214 [Pseudobacteriovorax antillogorgiicola]SMF64176.1 hypothetical protein SAMN06296036_12214 [Pseudobacteriovorax antillogorgiicola]